MGMHMGPQNRPRAYCRGRTQGNKCDCSGTFASVYEMQIQWYLENFRIPDDYQQQLLEAHSKLEESYDEKGKLKVQLDNRLERIKDLYKWQHLTKDEYLNEYDEIQSKLKQLAPDRDNNLDGLAELMKSVAYGWEQGNQEQRNRLAHTLFEKIIIEDNRVTGVIPRRELEPFFRLSYEDHYKSLTSDPDGAPVGGFRRLFSTLLVREGKECLQFWSRSNGNNLPVFNPYFFKELSA